MLYVNWPLRTIKRPYKPVVSHTANRFLTLVHKVLLVTVKVCVCCCTSGTVTTRAMFLRNPTLTLIYYTQFLEHLFNYERTRHSFQQVSMPAQATKHHADFYVYREREKSDQIKELTVSLSSSFLLQ